MHRDLIVVCLMLLVACAPQAALSPGAPTSAPSSITPALPVTDPVAARPTDTLTATMPPSVPPTIPGAVPTTLVPVIETPLTPQPGLIIRGSVQLADGSPVPDISICRSYASYPGTIVARTDANGYFQSQFAFIPGDEMVSVWAVAEGYTFQPDSYRWRHYYGSEDRGLDFIATPGTDTPAAPIPCQ